MWFWIIGIIIVLGIISAAVEAVGGLTNAVVIIACITLAIFFFREFSWKGIFILIAIIAGLVVLFLVGQAFHSFIKEREDKKIELADRKLKILQEERKRKACEEYVSTFNKRRTGCSASEYDNRPERTQKIDENEFRYTDVPLTNGTCDVVGNPENFKITFITNSSYKIAFDVKDGLISTYSFLSRDEKHEGKYEVG